MDRITNQLLSVFDFDFKVVNADTLATIGKNATPVKVPRWDILMRDNVNRHARRGMSPRKRLVGVYHWLLQLGHMLKLPSQIRTVHQLLAHQIPLGTPDMAGTDLQELQDTYLLIKRSAPPKAYERSALNKEATDYGTERRSLNGVEEAIDALGKAGIKAMAYEPGIHDIKHQINMLYHCKGIVGIRGAEFANMVWLKPKSKCIMIDTTHIDAPPPQRVLAKAMHLNYTELSTTEKHATLNAGSVIDLLRS